MHLTHSCTLHGKYVGITILENEFSRLIFRYLMYTRACISVRFRITRYSGRLGQYFLIWVIRRQMRPTRFISTFTAVAIVQFHNLPPCSTSETCFSKSTIAYFLKSVSPARLAKLQCLIKYNIYEYILRYIIPYSLHL